MPLVFFISMNLSAQNTWQTAQSIAHHSVTGPITAAYVDYWFSFVAQDTSVYLVAGPSSTISNASITTLELFSYNGTSIDLLLSLNRDTTISLAYQNLAIGNTYYIKVTNSNQPEPWILWSTESTIIVYEDDDCPPDCHNLVYNGNFESVSQLIYPTPVSYLADEHPFNILFHNNDYYENLVCHWNSSGSSEIESLNNSAAGYMYNLGGNGEVIYGEVKLKAGVTYSIRFNYLLFSLTAGTLPLVGKIVFSSHIGNIPTFTACDNIIANGNIVVQFPQCTTSTQFPTSGTYTFTPTVDINTMLICSVKSSTHNNELYIDNIVVEPPPPAQKPVLTYAPIICQNTPTFTFTISNYDPVYIYRYWIDGGSLQIAHSNQITINTASLGSGFHNIYIWNWDCEQPEIFTFYVSCPPSPGTDYIFSDGDEITSTTPFNGKKIFICGNVKIKANVTFNNCELKLSHWSKLTLEDGYNFTMNGGSLEDACNEPWDGIYTDNSNPGVSSKLILNGLTFIRGAYNAVVSSNNAEIELTNNYFVNNDISIKVRNYKPNLCGPIPIGQPPVIVPPYSAIITGNTFDKANYPFQAFNKFYGIQIDTVYDLTIGNENSNINIFKNINIGVKVNSSWVKIYHNKFENITNSTNPPVLSFNNKPMGKIGVMAESLIVPNNHTLNYPLPSSDQCVSWSIIVGKTGVNGGNEFVNCDFGVYSYKHYSEVVNNTFTSQRYNAVWVWDARSKVNLNTIQQMPGVWNNNENLNSAILIEKTFKNANCNFQIAEVKANTISNTRVGIQLINCATMPNNSAIKTKVESNNITFDDYSPPQIISGLTDYKNTGIWVAACDRSIVKSNSISNNSGVIVPNAGERSLIGIRVDKTREAWVSHNFALNYLGAGVWINGDCHNTQFSCNYFKACNNGIYTYTPQNSSGFAAIISHQGNPSLGRPQDNIFIQMPTSGTRVCGDININTPFTNYWKAKWYYRTGSNLYNPEIPQSNQSHEGDNTINATTSCTNGIIPPPDPNDIGYEDFVDENYGYIVRNEMDYIEYEDEFEYFDDEYLYNVLYNVPEIMNLGEPDDTAYINFYNYLTNRNVRNFLEVQELIDENNINQALMDNGAIVAQNVIEANKQYVNEIYLSSFAEDKYYTESQQQTLEAIAMLTPYIGGDAVYTARVMLGINPNTYQLPYRKGHFNDTTIAISFDNPVLVYPNPAQSQLTVEFLHTLETTDVFLLYNITGRKVLEQTLNPGTLKLNINVSGLDNGVYFYTVKSDNKAKGRIIINN